MSHGLVLGAVETGALENYVYADLAPGQLAGVSLSINGDFLTVNDNGILACLYSVQILTDHTAIALLSSVILQEVCEHSGVGQVVDGNYLITLSTEHLTESQTTDTAEAVNSNFY